MERALVRMEKDLLRGEGQWLLRQERSRGTARFAHSSSEGTYRRGRETEQRLGASCHACS